MAKNKKGKVIQMLTPENYIRKKARTLPIFECLVASEWEETRMSTVVIARNHINGNITACTYLVDLGCLGVKDSMFLFNVTMSQYSDLKEKVSSGIEMTEVDYSLAHNIILAGVEYAAEFGFKPCKEYESVTKFMLEEDTEEIELIEIECGTDGKPLYVQGPFEDHVKARQIIAQLEKAVGHGNYHFIMNVGDEFEDEYDDEDYELDDEYEFDDMTFEEKRKLFLSLSSNEDNLEEEETKRLFNITDSIVADLVGVDQYNHFYDQYLDELDIDIVVTEFPVQLLGVKPKDLADSRELTKRFFLIYQLSGENPELANKELILFKEESNGIPGAYFLELLLLQIEDSSEYAKRLKEYARTFPDYALIQILWSTWLLTSQKDVQQIPGYPFHLKTFFPDRETIHQLELFYLMTLYAIDAGREMDINKIEAFGSVIVEFEVSESQQAVLTAIIDLLKYGYLLKYVK